MKTGFTKQKCPKCGGNLYLDKVFYVEGGVMGWYEQESCLQCGYIRYQNERPQAEAAVSMTKPQSELLPV